MAGCSANDKSEAIASLDDLTQQKFIIESALVINLDEYFTDKTVVYKIRYRSDDCEVVGYIGTPVDYLEKEYPILMFNRGGNREFSKLYPDDIAFLATGNFIILASQYRGVDGGTGTEQFGGNDVDDVLKLIDISEDFSFAQKGGVYMAGSSRGGMMTYIACRRDSRIKAAAVFSGVSDTIASYHERGPDMKQVYIQLVGGTPDEMRAEYEKRSAVLWADEINVPLLIIHGGETDWRVETHHATDMGAALEKAGKEYKLIIYEEADHSLSGTNYLSDMSEWFRDHPLN